MKKVSLLAIAFLAAPAWSQMRIVSVTGVGSVEAVPDVAHVSYSVIDEGGLDKPVPQLVSENALRAETSLAAVKAAAGPRASVTAVPNLEEKYEYDQATRENKLVGYRMVTTIQATLKGEKEVAERLGSMFDTSKIQVNRVSPPTMALSERRLVSVKREAYKKAVRYAISEAKAQLEPGEKLGKALQRGNQVDASPRPKAFRAMAAAAPMGGGLESAGQAVVETGKVSVQVATNFVFQVLGRAKRLLGSR